MHCICNHHQQWLLAAGNGQVAGKTLVFHDRWMLSNVISLCKLYSFNLLTLLRQMLFVRARKPSTAGYSYDKTLRIKLNTDPNLTRNHGCIYIFFWIPDWPRILINILWHPLGANKDGGHIRRTWSIFNCSKELWDCLPTKPITTKHQSVFWLVSESRRMSAICVGVCRWISLAAASADPVLLTLYGPTSVCLTLTNPRDK